MIITNGNDIQSVYTSGHNVVEVYTYGEQVWPSYTKSYYIDWGSHLSSGTFTMNGNTYQFSHYGSSYLFSTGVITSMAFQSALITTVDTNAVSIQESAFRSITSLTVVNLPNCEYIGDRAFQRSSGGWNGVYTSLYTPVCSYIGENAFQYRLIHSLSIPSCEYIGNHAFEHCQLTYVDLPKCSYIGAWAFYDNQNMSVAYLSTCEYVDTYAFTNCYSLRAVYIYTSSVCGVDHASITFGYNSGGGTWTGPAIYVPSSLVSDYKTAQYWSEISGRIYAF